MQEKQIIEFLKKKCSYIQEQIENISKVISFLERTNNKTVVTNHHIGSKPKKRLQQTENYSRSSKLDQKIAFALSNIGSGFKEDILEILLKTDPLLDPYKLDKIISVRLSYLLKKNLISGFKIGRKYEYSLPEEGK